MMHEYTPGEEGRGRARVNRRRLAALAAVLACGAGSLAAGPAAWAAPGHRSTAPATAPTNSQLFGVSADSPTDAWAVGYYFGTRYDSLILHWNGTSWKNAASPNPGSATFLEAVRADSPTDAWAVGYYDPGPGTKPDSLILHWNGTSWKKMASPNPGSTNGTALYGVSAVSPTDAWAVGYYNTATQQDPLILHWNGISWTKAASPNPGGVGGTTFLNGVSADSSTDAWAVGSYTTAGANPPRSLTLHWNGTGWTQVPSPNPGSTIGTNGTTLYGASAVSATDAWAAGYYQNSSGVDRSLILRWDGTRWTKVASPNPGGAGTDLYGVSADSPTDAWAVGSNGLGTFTLHWDGTRWTQVASPSLGVSSTLGAVSAHSTTDAWATGYYSSRGPDTGFILRWDGTSWTRAG